MSTQATLAALTGIMANPSTKVFDQSGNMLQLPLAGIVALAHQLGIAYENQLAADWQSAKYMASKTNEPKVQIEDNLPF